jgi:hypothetical protein
MPVTNVTLVLDYQGSSLTHIIAYGYEEFGDDTQTFCLDSTDCGPFDTKFELGMWLARVLRLAHNGSLS